MKAFLLCFTLFLSAYLWAASFSLENNSSKAITTSHLNYKDSSVSVERSDCVKDMAIYCDYNTGFSDKQCNEKAVSACNGNPAAMRDISEATKAKSLEELRKIGLN